MKKLKVLSLCILASIMILSSTILATTLLPTGGSEYAYSPSSWNDTATLRSNCYQYAVLKMSSVDEKFKIQPGFISGDPLDIYTPVTKSEIISRVEDDLNVGLIPRDFYETTKYATPPSGYRKVALVICPGVDYHWYEQNSNGYWSHKRGLSNVTNLDASGNLISDPETCDKDYGYFQYLNLNGKLCYGKLEYSTFGGWFMVEN